MPPAFIPGIQSPKLDPDRARPARLAGIGLVQQTFIRHREPAVQNYDPEVSPNPAEWLALDEQLRIHLAEVYHRNACEKLPNLTAHAAFHVVVENQIAEELEPVVRAVARLIKQGLSRHDALHAVGSCVAEHVYEAMKTKDEDFASAAQARYNAAVERLTAESWERKYE